MPKVCVFRGQISCDYAYTLVLAYHSGFVTYGDCLFLVELSVLVGSGAESVIQFCKSGSM